MANSLGSLRVSLGLDTAEFTAGLTKAQYQAKKFGEALGGGIRSAGMLAAGALAAVGVSAVGAVAGFNALINGAADFQDIAEKTGASAEALASFGTAAGTAGTTVATIGDAMNKLTKNLTGVDDESKAAGAALGALGLNLQDFKKLSPEAQIEAISKSLAGFADGPGKAAVAMALLGKSGAELLPFLKALDEQGGRNVILTAQQIAQADEYADKQAKAKAELLQYAQALSTQALPAVTAFTGVLTDTVKELLGVGSAAAALGANTAVQTFAENTGRSLAGVMDYAQQSIKEFKALKDFVITSAAAIKKVGEFDFAGASKVGADFRQRYGLEEFKGEAENGKKAARTFVQAYNDTLAAGKRTAFSNQDPRRLDLGADGKPKNGPPALNFNGAFKPSRPGTGRSGGAEKDPTAEAQRYIESLQKQLEQTQSLTVQEQVLRDLQMDRFGQVTSAQKEQLLVVAGQIDAAKEYIAQKDREAQATAKADRAQQDMLNEGRRLFEEVRTPAELFADEQDRINTLLEAGAIDFVTAARAAEKYKKSFDESTKGFSELDKFTERATQNIQDTLGSGLAEIMDGNYKNIGDGFTKMLNRMAAEAIAADLAKRMFGGLVKGGEGEGWLGGLLKDFGSNFQGTGGSGGAGGLFSSIGGFFSGLFGKAGGGIVAGGSMHRVNENGPEMLDYQGKQFLMMGNRGGTITPNSGGGRAISVSVNQSFAPGTDRRTIEQAAAASGMQVQRALARGTAG